MLFCPCFSFKDQKQLKSPPRHPDPTLETAWKTRMSESAKLHGAHTCMGSLALLRQESSLNMPAYWQSFSGWRLASFSVWMLAFLFVAELAATKSVRCLLKTRR
jgi:hypothetical protein